MTNNTTNGDAKRKVDLLRFLQVAKEGQGKSDDLLLINAGGISENEFMGVPKLVPLLNKKQSVEDGILEFNFIISGRDEERKEKLEWNISVVYSMEQLPKGIRAIKVNAENNADIALIA